VQAIDLDSVMKKCVVTYMDVAVRCPGYADHAGCRLFAQQGRLSIDSDNSIRFKLEVSEWIDLPLSSGGFNRYSIRL
jgi:hypothetical protein